MSRSLPAPLASTHLTTQCTAEKASLRPKCSQLITHLTTSSFETLFLIFSLFFDCLKATLWTTAALLSLPVVPMLPIWLLFLFSPTGFPSCYCSVCGHWVQLWVADLRSFPLTKSEKKRKASQSAITPCFTAPLRLWWTPSDNTTSLLCSHPTSWCL